MRYRDFEFFASPKDGEIRSPSDISKEVKKTFFCEIYHAADEGMIKLLDCFFLKEGRDIPVNFEPGLIAALQRYVDTHYEELMATHEGRELPQKRDYLSDLLHNTDFNLLYQQKQALLTAREHHLPIDTETIDGLVNFLDFIGDWAEQEGVFEYPTFDEEPSFVDELIALAEEELNEVGKITYYTPDNKYLIMATVEKASEDAVNPGEEYYWLSCMQNLPGGQAGIFSGAAAYNDFDALKDLCQSAASWIEERKTQTPLSLDSIISSASGRTGTPSASGKAPEPEIT